MIKLQTSMRRGAIIGVASLIVACGNAPESAVDANAQTEAVKSRTVSLAGETPNIVMVVTDDLGWGDVSAYGHPHIKTPNIDKLASEGRMFTQFYVASPVCSPSRASFVSGRFSPEIGIHYAIGAAAGDDLNSEPWLSPDIPNIYRVFQNAGYRTGHFGKWHMGAETTRGKAPPPKDYGLDESGTTNSTGTKLKAGKSVVVEGTLGGQKGKEKNGLPRSGSTAAIVDAGIDFIKRRDERPFLLSLWTLEPHAILDPTPEQMKPFLKFTHPQVVGHMKGSQTVYYASLANIDAEMGRLMDYLDDAGLRENTVVIFTSDNGPSPLWSKGTSHAGAGLAGPFRGVKGSLYEGGVRVPFIARWPGKIPQNTVNDKTVVSAVDLLPTLASLSGASDLIAGADLDGENLAPELLGDNTERTSPLFWDYRAGSWGRDIQMSPRLAMREGDWKLMMNPDSSRVELYNLSQDMSETSNVALYEKDRVKVMSAKLLKWFDEQVPEHERAAGHAGKKKWRMP